MSDPYNPTPVVNPALTGQQLMRLDDIFHIEVKVERNFGDVHITFGLSANYIAVNSDQLKQAYDELRSIVENQFELAMKNRPQLMPTQLKEHLSQNQQIVLATHVRKDMIKGAERLRILGGEYSTHGIAVYPEYFEKLGINPETLIVGDNPYNNYVIVQFNNNGQPVRVIDRVQVD